MEIEEYIEVKIELQNLFLDYIDNNNDEDKKYELLINYFKINQIADNKSEIRAFFHFINIISLYHHRTPNFFQKIENIINYFKDLIKKLFSNIELIELFWDNKRILLFLYDKKIIFFDTKDIYRRWLYSNIYNIHKLVYFYPEIKLCIDDAIMLEKLSEFLPQTMKNFENDRRKGENDLYICSLIREDLVIEFIKYVIKYDN